MRTRNHSLSDAILIKNKIIFLLLILVVPPFYNVLIIHADLSTSPFTPVSHTIPIAMTQYGSYNTSEIDVSRNTTYTIIFVNKQNEIPSDLTILKPGIFVTNGNCTNISSQFYSLKLGPISNTTANTTIKGLWSSPVFDTWIIYYNSNDSGCGGGASLNLIKVGTPTLPPPSISLKEQPGFESGIFIIAMSVLVILRIRKHNKKH